MLSFPEFLTAINRPNLINDIDGHIMYIDYAAQEQAEQESIERLEPSLTELNEKYMKKDEVLSEPKVIYGNSVHYVTSLICKISA